MRFLFLSILLFGLQFNFWAQNWQQSSDFPGSARDDGASFTIGEIHYLGTGRSIDFSCTGDFFAYNSYQDNWYPIASLPLWQERQYACAFAHEQNGYIVGGENCNGFYFNSFWKYNPLTNIWSEMPALPADGRAGCQQFILGSDFYLIGGRNASGILNEVWCFHFDTQIWEQKDNLPFEGCWRGLAFSAGNTGFLAGGRTNTNNQTGWNAQTWQYESQTDSWTSSSLIDFGSRMYVNTAQADSLLFVYGGVNPNDQTFISLEKINLNTLEKTNMSAFSSMPRKGCMSFAGNGYFFLSTGISGNDRLKETWRLAFLPNAITSENDEFFVFGLLEGANVLIRIAPNWIGEILNIRDIQGKILYAQKLEQIEEVLNLAFLPSGTYFIEIKGFSRKFLR